MQLTFTSQVDLISHEMVDVGDTAIVEIAFEPVAAEGNGTPVVVSDTWYRVRCCFVHLPFPLNRQPTRTRSGNLERRRALRSRKSDLIDEIRTIVALEHTASPLEVLNAGTGVQPFAVVDSDTHPFSQSSKKLGVPRPSSHPTVKPRGWRTNGFTSVQAAKDD